MLPNFTRLEEFNRLLIYLEDSGGQLSRSTLLDIFHSESFHGLLPDHSATISAAVLTELVRLEDDRLLLAPLGRQFLALNPECLYELSPGQARFLYSSIIRHDPYTAVARAFLVMFQSRGRTPGFRLDLNVIALSSDQILLLSIFRRLGVVVVSDGIATITREFEPQVSVARARRAISIEELELALLQQKLQGNAAEMMVLEWERQRLIKAGFPLEAEAVSLVSEVDVAAGYDIESFDGSSLALTPDRFIEVKSTTGHAGAFFWTANEYATAEELGDRYWICHVRGFSTGRVEDVRRAWIQNPVARVTSGELVLTCSQFRAVFNIDTAENAE